MRERGLVVGRSKKKICNTVQFNTLSWYTWHVGVASGSAYLFVIPGILRFLAGWHRYNGTYMYKRGGSASTRETRKSLYRSGLFYYSNLDQLERRTISARRETRQIARSDPQSRHTSYILNKPNSAQQRKYKLGTNGRYYDAMCVSWVSQKLSTLFYKAQYSTYLGVLVIFLHISYRFDDQEPFIYACHNYIYFTFSLKKLLDSIQNSRSR